MVLRKINTVYILWLHAQVRCCLLDFNSFKNQNISRQYGMAFLPGAVNT